MSLIVMVCGRHGCGHHGDCLWPSWFVAVMVIVCGHRCRTPQQRMRRSTSNSVEFSVLQNEWCDEGPEVDEQADPAGRHLHPHRHDVRAGAHLRSARSVHKQDTQNPLSTTVHTLKALHLSTEIRWYNRGKKN